MRVRKFVSRGCAKDGASAFIMRMTALRHKRSINPPQGCHLHPRCPHASAVCSAVEPALAEITPGHWVACHPHTTFALMAEPTAIAKRRLYDWEAFGTVGVFGECPLCVGSRCDAVAVAQQSTETMPMTSSSFPMPSYLRF